MKNMEKIRSLCSALDTSNLLPNIGDYHLQINMEETVEGFLLISYVNGNGWAWNALYDKEVDDYTVKIVLPLFSFNDISFIVEGSVEQYWNTLLERYKGAIESSLIYPEQKFSAAFLEKGISTWDYSAVLPDSVGLCNLTIRPNQSICAINGSYVIGQYSKENEPSGLLIRYNILRDEFYGELFKNGKSVPTHELDVSTLINLEKALEKELYSLLKKIE